MSYPVLATPPRALPGTYFATPAPLRSQELVGLQQRNVQRTPPSTSLAALQAKPKVDLKPQERAAKTINDTLAQEARYPELDSYLSHGFSSDYDIKLSPSWAPFQKVKVHSIPDQIFEQYNRAQVSTSMGLFAEINHAWVAIDNALYLWNYEQSNPQLVGFESQPNSINAVKLAVPRPGVFLPNITHVLVIATTQEVILLGLSCQAGAGGIQQLTMFNTGMAVGVRGLHVDVIASSDTTGRIFFSGTSTNDVYELTYHQEEKWFQNRCGKINHTNGGIAAFVPSFSFAQAKTEYVKQMVVDDSRSLVYTLSSASTIRVFHMRSDGSLHLAITKAAADIYSNVGHIISSNETLNVKIPIVSINPVPKHEATRYHLVATTTTGYRIYLSATSSNLYGSASNSAPTSMQAQHVKTPPPPDAVAPAAGFQTAGKMPIQTLNPTTSASRFSPGFFFCFTSKDTTRRVDTLFISSPDPGRLARPQEGTLTGRAAETAIWLSLGSRAEAVGITKSSTVTNELAVQFDQDATEVAILTNTGIHIIRRRRLVDIFAALVRHGGGEEGIEGEVKSFIRLYGRGETMATALAVACGQGKEVSTDRLSSITDPEVLEFARRVFVEYGGRPVINENSLPDQPAVDAVVPSPRHDGIALYLTRLLRSIWQSRIAVAASTPAGGMTYVSAVAMSKLLATQRDLTTLQDFFSRNKTFIEGLSGPEALSRASTRQEEVSLQAEHRALYSLVQLVSTMIEGIAFVIELFKEDVAEIVAILSEESRPRFTELTFEALFTTDQGYSLAKELVKAIVNRNIAKGGNVEAVADFLRRRCGRFCSPEDVVIFKAQEQLKKATENGGNTEIGRILLNESLILFEQVAENLSMDYLVAAVREYTEMQFYAGAIQLALSVAKSSDPANRAASWVADGRPAGDPREIQYETRKQCYVLIQEIIQAVDTAAASDPGIIDGNFTALARRRNEAYDQISSSKDEVFLTDLYDWYLEQGWSDRLLETSSPFVVTYLQRKGASDISHADLLWRYYALSKKYYEAAVVQFDLAQSSFALNLSKRIEYLGRARSNASIQSIEVGRQMRQRLIQQINEMMDVANVQGDLLVKLKEDERIDPARKREVLDEVDGPVQDISDLFNKFADPGGYHDICLMIYQVGDYRSTPDIKRTWRLLIEDTHAETLARGDLQPYEAVIDRVRTLGSRLRLSETTFPISELLPLLSRYAFENQRGVGPETWVIDLFMDLQVPFETLYTVLESMFYNAEAPFTGANIKYVANDMLYLLQRWFQDSMRAGGSGAPIFGSEEAAQSVLELLPLLAKVGLDQQRMMLAQELQKRIEDMLF